MLRTTPTLRCVRSRPCQVRYIVDKEDVWSVDKVLDESVWIKKDGSLTILVDEFSTENITIRLGLSATRT